jgi:di/tricarboxylate transporter
LTTDIAIVLAILTVTVILFFTEWLRADLIALLVIGSLVITGILEPGEALSGFSNAAVITVWAMFIISGALYRTGIAHNIGQRILNLAGSSEKRLIAIIMLTAGVLSGFMNNVGVAAMLLPVVMSISRRTKLAPSKLMLPLAIGCLLGGMTTLIGTPPNILASEALTEFGFNPFNFFDFTPMGVIILLSGVTFVVLIGRLLLPERDISREIREVSTAGLEHVYEIDQDLYILKVPQDSILSGKTLQEIKLGTMLNSNVIGIIRNGKTKLAPSAEAVINSSDQLIVSGGLDRLSELHDHQLLTLERGNISFEDMITQGTELREVTIAENSELIGHSLKEIDFRHRFGVLVLAIKRDGTPIRVHLDNIPLQAGDVLLIQGNDENIQKLVDQPDFIHITQGDPGTFRLQSNLLAVRIPDDSALIGKPLSESRLAEAFGLTVLGIVRQGKTLPLPDAHQVLHAGDILFVKGEEYSIQMLQGLHELDIEENMHPEKGYLESEQVGMIEVVLSPHSTLPGKTLRQIHFREKFGLSVLGIFRSGHVYRSDLSEMPLEFGDGLLLFGKRDRFPLLSSEPDLIVLSKKIQETPRTKKAPIAIFILVGVVVAVLLNVLPIAIAAVIGAALMVLSGALTMDEAYRFIDWRSVFLIAGLIPLGIAMENTGAANFIAQAVITRLNTFGPLAIIAGIFLLTNLGSQVMPNSVVTVLMAPIAINSAMDLQISPYALMMTVAIAASAAFMSPVAHPANILVMAPGGYSSKDFIKIGLPLTILVLLIVLVFLPIFWPL